MFSETSSSLNYMDTILLKMRFTTHRLVSQRITEELLEKFCRPFSSSEVIEA